MNNIGYSILENYKCSLLARTINNRYRRKLRKSLRRNTPTHIVSHHHDVDTLYEHNNDVIRLLGTSNAGGSSVISEALSFYIIQQIFHRLGSSIQLHKTETELVYKPGSKITDYAIRYHNQVIGCSVVRFFNYYNFHQVISHTEIERLLTKKLQGIIESSTNVISDAWTRQILHIITPNKRTAMLTCGLLHEPKFRALISNTIVVITVSKLRCIYTDKR